MPLRMLKAGDTAKVQRVTGTDEVRSHLSELGFVPGTAVTVVNNIGGNMIVQVKDSRVAIDEKMANRVIVA
jgi:ferrous iron transport protein A